MFYASLIPSSACTRPAPALYSSPFSLFPASVPELPLDLRTRDCLTHLGRLSSRGTKKGFLKKRLPRPAQARERDPLGLDFSGRQPEAAFPHCSMDSMFLFLGGEQGGRKVEKWQSPFQEKYKWSKLYSICQYFFFL